jgi:hypothetical protein
MQFFHNSDLFRSVLIILRELLNVMKASVNHSLLNTLKFGIVHVCFNDVQQLPENNQEKSKHIGLIKKLRLKM